MSEHLLHITRDGRDYTLTPEQAERVARRMAEHDDPIAPWSETAMLLLDFAEAARGEER